MGRQITARNRLRSLQTAALAALLCAKLTGFAGPAAAQQAPEFFNEPDAPAAAGAEEAAVDYTVKLTGIEDGDLQSILEASSQLISLTDNPPATTIGLRRRAKADVERLQAALRSEGFYASQIDLDIDTQAQPAVVDLIILTGPRYSLRSYEISYVENTPPPEDVQPMLGDIDIRIGMPARAPAIVAAEQNLVNLLLERGHPFAHVAERKTFVDNEKMEMTVRLAVAAGPRATFGPLSFEGQEQVRADYLQRIAEWPEGTLYDRRIVRQMQRKISETGLFSTVNAETDTAPKADGSLPVTVTLVEREHRSIGIGASISSDIGAGGEVFWEHRNFFGENERLRVSGTGSLIEQTGRIDFRKPAFLRPDQALLADLTGGFQDNDAFERQSIEGLVALERSVLENWRVSAGVSAGYEIVDENANGQTGERQFTLFGLPLTAARDTTDDPLDPASGTRLLFSLTPTTGVGDESLLFLTAVVGGSAYYAIDEAERFVLAGRARVGSIVGEETEVLPANRRFYAGGGGSIRGYEYQLVGPLDDDDDPFGGSSLVELGAEIRVRVTDEIGVVPFIDGGTVYDDPWFNGDDPLRWAAGLGLRYFTGFGPVRLDVAFPLNRRDDVDDAFQFYVSFGQAF
ncbi:outer membrane protein assembly factor [Pelagibius litoralis]|uniref:Outer membrane protein assembly factor n=1 Tax=Pelagibius litoralis TaxID=374515 RepID=A0A967F1F8_9PROT|nr:autotransporter assembly complex family protein [Pelagibius litoralis]NIA71403.1 outer membrane protein assembly factor [Pelagibius litoralis]